MLQVNGSQIDSSTSVTFTADSVSAGVSSFSVAPSTATVAASASASGRPVVTIELTDQFGNPVSVWRRV